MADITNPQVVKWSNERARTISDSLALLYAKIVAYQNDYSAQGIATAMNSAAAVDIVLDGSANDGRAPVTKNQLVVLNNCITQIKTALDTTTVSGYAPTVWINQIQVNGSPR